MLRADVAIVGGGPAGLSTAHAVLVARPGTKVAVLERSDLQPRGAVFGLGPNGVRAMEAIQPALKAALARHHMDHIKTRAYDLQGNLVQSSDTDGGSMARVREHGELISLPWHALQRELADALPPGLLHLNHKFLRYSESYDGVVAEFATPEGGVCSVEAQLLVGCDGGQSLVREQLLGDGPPQYQGMAIWRAVCPRPADWVVDKGRATWGGPGQVTILTNTLQGGRVSWQVFCPWPADQLHVIGGGRRAYIQDADAAAQEAAAGGGGAAAAAKLASLQRLERVLGMLEKHPQIVKDLVAGTDPASITEHGQFSRDAAQCQTYARGRVGLVGDAAHLSTPFLAQGCSQAIEDALELGRAVGALGPTPEALAAYEQVRLPLASAVQSVSLELFKGFTSGKIGRSEIDANIEEGFFKRTFEPLRPAAAVRAA